MVVRLEMYVSFGYKHWLGSENNKNDCLPPTCLFIALHLGHRGLGARIRISSCNISDHFLVSQSDCIVRL